MPRSVLPRREPMLKWIVKTHSKRFLCALLIGSFCPSIGLAQALAAKPICEVIAAAAAAATPAEQRETVLTLKLALSAEAVTWFEKWKTGEIFLGEGGMSLYFAAAIPVSFLVAALVGILLERAVMQNRDMAACMGVRTERVNTITFAFGCGQAGLAGAFLSQIGNVGPSMGQFYIVDSFMTVVVGGAGNILGTVISALGIGMADQTLQQYLGNPIIGKILVLGAIILFLQWRPAGLFVTRSRSLD